MTVRTTNHEWLGLTVEEPLEPELPICDPHHHLWDKVSGTVARAICSTRSSRTSAAGTSRVDRVHRVRCDVQGRRAGGVAVLG